MKKLFNNWSISLAIPLIGGGLFLNGIPLSAASDMELSALADELENQAALERGQAEALALDKDLPIWQQIGDQILEIQGVERGMPLYNMTYNLNAAESVQVDELWLGGGLGLGLTGAGYDKLGEWDGGGVLLTHQEFGGRVAQMDSPLEVADHSTHVAATMMASGVVPAAKGMAYEANLKAYDWNNDMVEMIQAAGKGLELSNHSYGYLLGWRYDLFQDGRYAWVGDPAISTTEDYGFGLYHASTRVWDLIAYLLPNYLIVKAAGNDRIDKGPAPGTEHWAWDLGVGDFVLSTAVHDPDGGEDGYDSIGVRGTAKNILTVGAVLDVPTCLGSEVQMSSFSGWGPTDDGRIKPDLVGNGINLYSAVGTTGNEYDFYSGTSMATPNVTGGLALLQQHYQNLNGGTVLRSATLKALAIHTAEETGIAAGPDYQFGWGLFNAERAAQLITDDQNNGGANIRVATLNDGDVFEDTIVVPADAEELRVTVVWTDYAGTPVNPPVLNPTTRMLVNDLDLRIIRDADSQVFSPWVLDPANPDQPATTGDNDRDNVEQVVVNNPAAGTYTLQVSHKGVLERDLQEFSVIVSTDRLVSDYSKVCQLYGVDDQGLNNSQFFTLNTDGSFKNVGPVHKGYDIEALAASPVDQKLYATSGDDTDNQGYLYRLEANGTLITIGDVAGFEEIDALAFRPDGTLWAWAQGQGLIQIDTGNADSSLVLPYDGEIEGLTWDVEGRILYAVENEHGGRDPDSETDTQGVILWAYNYEDGVVKAKCDLLDEGVSEVESLETLPDNTLLFSYHNANQFVSGRIKPDSCRTTPLSVDFEMPYRDVEGFALVD